MPFSSTTVQHNRTGNKDKMFRARHGSRELLQMVAWSIVLVPLLLLFFSVDSPFYEIWGRIDPSWYFTAGKAWMHGMIPYVDFSDSKGPLLWLIYGIGYLISNFDYVGVWLLTCVNYLVTTWFIYGIARIFVDSKCLSFLVAVVMLAVYFNPVIHHFTKSEDFCQPYIALGLWSICRVLYDKLRDNSLLRNRICQGAWFIGISMGATLMIKFTIALMISFFAIVLCIAARKSGVVRVKDVVWRVLAGCAVVCLPFVVYFAILGNLDDFIREYFVLTSKISSHSPRLNVIKWTIGGGFLSWLIITMSISTATFFFITKKYSWVPIAGFFWFLLITVQNAEWTYYYYSCMIFAVFGLIALVKWGSKFIKSMWTKAIAVALCLLITGVMSFSHASHIATFKLVDHSDDPLMAKGAEFYHQVDLVKRVEKPRVVFLNYNNVINVADAVDGLPGCKYWAKQYGANFMQEEQYKQIKTNRPHFVYIKQDDPYNKDRIERLGYFCINQPSPFYKVYLYANPKLRKIYLDR